ncbi:uracil-DNA glycosylase [Primorskyibacter sp. S187A]|uniref:uracil-DNA glycosylase n=1 Tax=Primorskyibacter sp. S187A TaxID=3415130 RepID=UPI003C7CF7CA
MTHRDAQRAGTPPSAPTAGADAPFPDGGVPHAWAHLPFFEDRWPTLQTELAGDPRKILPPAPQIFAALDACPPDAARVVILGQDPYPTPGHAHGFAFSVEPDVSPLPRSLQNIFKEMEADLGARPATGDLRFWAAQGVLLLNAALTVPAGDAGGHLKLGWKDLLTQVLKSLDDRPRALVLWGAFARSEGQIAQNPSHLRIETAHPSPLSARRGFFGSRPFSRVNDWLTKQGDTAINWTRS